MVKCYTLIVFVFFFYLLFLLAIVFSLWKSGYIFVVVVFYIVLSYFIFSFVFSVNFGLLMLLALDVDFVIFVFFFLTFAISLKHRQPSSCGYQCYRLPSKILQMIFYHLHLYRQIQWFYRRFVEVAYLSGYCQPSFSAPEIARRLI